MHVGVQDEPCASVEVHPEPGAPFVMAPDASQGLTEHVAAVSVPALHDDVPDAVYPASHVGWHVDPLARVLVQSPTAPFVGAVDASHGFAEHVAALRVPNEHELVPETVYSASHVGWHVDQLARELVQSPTAPFVGAADASHGDPNTLTGVVRWVVVPSPSWPKLFLPQHFTLPSVSTAHE